MAHLLPPAHFSTAIRRFKHGLTGSKRNHNIITIVVRIRPRRIHIPAFRPLGGMPLLSASALLRPFQPHPSPGISLSLSLFLKADATDVAFFATISILFIRSVADAHSPCISSFRCLRAERRRIGKHNNPENTAAFLLSRFPRDDRRKSPI